MLIRHQLLDVVVMCSGMGGAMAILRTRTMIHGRIELLGVQMVGEQVRQCAVAGECCDKMVA